MVVCVDFGWGLLASQLGLQKGAPLNPLSQPFVSGSSVIWPMKCLGYMLGFDQRGRAALLQQVVIEPGWGQQGIVCTELECVGFHMPCPSAHLCWNMPAYTRGVARLPNWGTRKDFALAFGQPPLSQPQISDMNFRVGALPPKALPFPSLAS